ncbi:hypothetical protein [Methylobacterium nodulans]|uniref:Uncharacterized protein n=1 Tax=Methylobacterium nodulans (strain LMG 21967 / CNCM I-2342 / ORS 2060) TaxID=460265 RepID=B8ID52_METNO|nr:hypothetical protein [Methylobacterium nodulans]ACL59444.1 conserved hypothetical protein [Methylobacterium nodulans ORS 2060]
MILAACEGRHWQYEIAEHADGYAVRMRDLYTGDVDDDFVTIFRTMPVALAYAQMSAAFDRFASGDEADEDPESATDLELCERTFVDLSSRLCDGGISGTALEAWEEQRTGQPRRALH